MPDDDDLLIDEDDAVADAGGDEEDLLADVAVPAAAHAWNFSDAPLPSSDPGADAAIFDDAVAPTSIYTPEESAAPPPPRAAPLRPGSGPAPRNAPPPPRAAPPPPPARPPPAAPVEEERSVDDIFGSASDLPGPDVDELDLEIAEPARAVKPVKNVPALLVDPDGGDTGVLATMVRDLGFNLTVVETGSAARDELNTGNHLLVFLSVGDDGGWARILITSTLERWENVVFIPVLPRPNAAAGAAMRAAGATEVIQGIPTQNQLLALVQAAAPAMFPAANDPHARELANELRELRAELGRKAEEIAGANARAVQAEKDLVAFRQRHDATEGELRKLRETVAQLERAVAQAQASGAMDPSAARIKPLAAALGPYGVAVDQAIEFLDAASRVATHGTPAEWQRHVKNLNLARQVMKRLEAAARTPE